MNTVFTPEDVRQYYEEAVAHERAQASKHFVAAITCKGDFREYNRLMDLSAAAQARAMALWQEMDNALARAEVLAEKAKEFERIRASVWREAEAIELKAPRTKTTFRRVVVRKLRPSASP